MINNLFEIDLSFLSKSNRFDSKGGVVYELVQTKSTTSIIQNGIGSLLDRERLIALIRLPIKIFMKLKTVEINIVPKHLKKNKPQIKGSQSIGNRNKDGICGECLGIILIRPKKSLKELKGSTSTGIINPF